MTPLHVAPLPVGNLVKVFSAHPEDGLEVRVGQMSLQVLGIDVARKSIVGRLQKVDRVDVGRGREEGPVVRVRHVRQGPVEFRSRLSGLTGGLGPDVRMRRGGHGHGGDDGRPLGLAEVKLAVGHVGLAAEVCAVRFVGIVGGKSGNIYFYFSMKSSKVLKFYRCQSHPNKISGNSYNTYLKSVHWKDIKVNYY